MAGKKDNEKNKKREDRGGVLQALALTTTIGAELAISVVLGYYGGKYLDQMYGVGSWFTLTGVLVGLAIGTISVYKTLRGFLGE